MKFTDFNLEQTLQNGLTSMRFDEATPIQEQTIPIILANNDLIACAQTGTGKTAAFLLPILNKLVLNPVSYTDTLIVVPTRELALQIDQVLQGFSYFTNVTSIAIYGGSDGNAFDQEKRALENHANIIIATPGRLITHLNMGNVKFSHVKHFILDEADRMLDMGFFEDIIKINSFLPKERQTILFSATMPVKIRDMAKKLMNNPQQINIAMSKPAEGVLQAGYLVGDNQKIELIKSLLIGKEDLIVLIFASTKVKVKALESELRHAHFKVKAIHSDLDQSEREERLRNFRSRQINILVATDIISRGIDIDDIGLVINFDVPDDAEDYIHRIGRTARADTSGVALIFVNSKDQQKLLRIEQFLGSPIKKLPLPPHLGTSETYAPNAIRKQKRFFGKDRRKKGI